MTPQTIAAGKHFIYFDPDRYDYTVTPAELEVLQSAGANSWKDLCLVPGSLAIPCLINAASAWRDTPNITLALFLNCVVGMVGVGLACGFGIAWWNSSKAAREMVARIKAKPRHELPPTSTNLGEISSVGNPDVSHAK